MTTFATGASGHAALNPGMDGSIDAAHNPGMDGSIDAGIEAPVGPAQTHLALFRALAVARIAARIDAIDEPVPPWLLGMLAAAMRHGWSASPYQEWGRDPDPVPDALSAWVPDPGRDAARPVHGGLADQARECQDRLDTHEAITSGGTGLRRLDRGSALLLVGAGLIEDDIRFGTLFARLQQPLVSRRPCLGLLTWLLAEPGEGVGSAVNRARDLTAAGLVDIDNPGDPRSEWVLRVPVPVWDLITTGAVGPASLPAGMRLAPPAAYPRLADVIGRTRPHDVARRLPELLAAGDDLGAVVVRGRRGAGRTTLLGAAAAELDRGTLGYDVPPARAGDPAVEGPAWRLLAALTTLGDYQPILRIRATPGTATPVPRLPGRPGPIGVVTGRAGSLTGPGVETALTIEVCPSTAAERRTAWARTGLSIRPDQLERIIDTFDAPPGDITRMAATAAVWARARDAGRITGAARIPDAGRITGAGWIPDAGGITGAARITGAGWITDADVLEAHRRLDRAGLEELATYLPSEDAREPVLTEAASAEFEVLVSRCRHRERLVAAAAGTPLGPGRGVRALFAGPSGTGKTLAARHLAARLGLDLYRVDLAAVVDKYLGETERRLDGVLTRAEELGVVVLLDEGDALMTGRTDVGNANDRYANLETNFLLQRLETFEGILVVTTNAAGRIDQAFLRRIDVTVDFVPPEAQQRLEIWAAHLPAGHGVGPALLSDVARRCALTGGQIRGAALHATLLAVESGGTLGPEQLLEGVHREYRRAGARCPLATPPRSQGGGDVVLP